MKILKRLEKANKALFSLILSLSLRPRGEKEIPGRDEIRRILLVRHDDRLGNLVMLTPLLSALRSHLPHARVTMLVGKRYSDLFKHDRRIDELLIFTRGLGPRNLLGILRLAIRLRKEEFDIALDLSHGHSFSLTNALLIRFSKSMVRIGYKRGLSNRFIDNELRMSVHVTHEINIFLGLLRTVIEVPVDLEPKIALRDEDLRGGRELLRRIGFRGREAVVGIHPGGRGDKLWPIQNFLRVAELLKESGAEVVFFLGNPERRLISMAHAEGRFKILKGSSTSAEAESQSGSPDSSSFGAFQPSGVIELAALIKNCSVFLSGDCGPMHLAAGLKVPTVTIFLVENYGRYGYAGEMNRILHGPGAVNPETAADCVEELLKLSEEKRSS
ncbi:MAG: glycosyltransferase family 9 protein [Candidatus Eisenbacteria bacterium]|nr:glycosyltransferase family 9 protein [Candidatus Eisenbacteria bacterium]